MTYTYMSCVLQEGDLVEEFLQVVDYKKGIKGEEMKELVRGYTGYYKIRNGIVVNAASRA